MNLLKTIIERLNQRVEVANIFDQIYPLCELNANGNDKAWVHYIGNGQAEVVTNFDAKQGTLFWAKRGKVSVTKTESLKVSGCKSLYLTTFPLTAYAVVRKSHLPCDSEDSQDWIASRIYRLISGTDTDFKQAIGVIQYEVIPNGYINEIKSLTANYEWACVAVDVDVNVVTSSEDGCYDVCATGDIPLPDLQPCVPCLTEVAVDGVTIIGNGTIGDPLIAIGGGGGGGVMTAIAFSIDHLASTGNQYVIGNVVWYLGNIYRCIANNDSLLPTNTNYWVNLGAGFETIERPINWNATSGNNQILNKPSIPAAQVNSDWNSVSGVSEILNKPTIPILPATIVEDVTATLPISSSGGTNPDISISQASTSTDGYLSSTDWNFFDGKFDVPTGTITDYLDGLGTPTLFPTSLPPSGAASGDLSGTYPSPEVHKIHGVDMQSGTPTADDLWIYGGAPAKWQHGKIKTINSNTLIGNGNISVEPTITAGTSLQYYRGDKTFQTLNKSAVGLANVDNTSDVNKPISTATQNALNLKQDAITLTTTGSSGAATLVGTTLNIPQYATISIYKSTTDGAASSGTANTFSQSFLVTGNSVALGNILEFKLRSRKTGALGVYTIRLYANSVNNLTGAVLLGTYSGGAAAAIGQQMVRTAAIKNITTNTEMLLGTTSLATDFANSTFSSIAVDWTSDKYIIGAVQNTNATDSSLISLISMTII